MKAVSCGSGAHSHNLTDGLLGFSAFAPLPLLKMSDLPHTHGKPNGSQIINTTST